jgi:hypothetical protein
MTTDELVAMNNWKAYMAHIHKEVRKDVLRSTYNTLCTILPDPIERSILAVNMKSYEIKEWREMAEFRQQAIKGLL